MHLLVGIGKNAAYVGCVILSRNLREHAFQPALGCTVKGVGHFGFGYLHGGVQSVAAFWARISLHGLACGLRCGRSEGLSQSRRPLAQLAQRAFNVGCFQLLYARITLNELFVGQPQEHGYNALARGRHLRLQLILQCFYLRLVVSLLRSNLYKAFKLVAFHRHKVVNHKLRTAFGTAFGEEIFDESR